MWKLKLYIVKKAISQELIDWCVNAWNEIFPFHPLIENYEWPRKCNLYHSCIIVKYENSHPRAWWKNDKWTPTRSLWSLIGWSIQTPSRDFLGKRSDQNNSIFDDSKIFENIRFCLKLLYREIPENIIYCEWTSTVWEHGRTRDRKIVEVHEIAEFRVG